MLAGRTVMTATLTRLVVAAQASHRRLAYQLDQLAPSGLDLALVPPRLPVDLYERYCLGVFACTPSTVRTFASLCLARLAVPVSSWPAAALRLGLDGETGRKTAVAASARTLVPTFTWLRTLSVLQENLRSARPQAPDCERAAASLTIGSAYVGAVGG